METTEQAKYDKNIDDLINAARLKLEAQQKEEAKNAAPAEDIYADIREESEHDNINTNIAHTPTYNTDDFDIKHNGIPEPDYYVDPDDTPIFKDGPGQSQLDIWRKQFTHEKIFHTQILEKHFIFRTLNRFEYKQIVGIENIDALYREEVICRTCVLWPYNYDFQKMAVEDGGYPSTLAQIIMENSGFTKEYGIEVL